MSVPRASMFLVACSLGVIEAGEPFAVNDSYETTRKKSLAVDAPGVLENDQGDNVERLIAELVSGPASGSNLQFEPDGAFEYDPPENADELDRDTFTYRVRDGALQSAPATVTIEFISAPRGEVVLYVDEGDFLRDLGSLGHELISEGFEDDAAWGNVRTSVAERHTSPEVTSQGLTWSANNETSEITTGPGPARSGEWGFFALPHGNYATGTDCHLPGVCTDGFRARAAGTLFGIGGWIHSSPPGKAKIRIVLDDDPARSVEFGNDLALTGFFGVIAPAGFHGFEYREMEGKAEDQVLLFADDFTFARDTGTPAPGFIRGDANSDGVLDVSDPVRTLLVLFVSPAKPDCEDALDANADRLVDVSDALYLLAHLFRHGPPPTAPYPRCGPGPVAERLPCGVTSCP